MAPTSIAGADHECSALDSHRSMMESWLVHGKRPQPGPRASYRARLDAARARRPGGRLASEHQFDRMQSIRPQPGAGADLRADFRTLHRLDLRIGEETMSILGGQIDERFLMHRLRSTSLAAMAGGALALGLFLYHYWFQHVWNWELL